MVFLLGAGLAASMRIVSGPLKTVNYAAGPACRRTLSWMCALSQQDLATITQYNLRYRLAVYNESGELQASTNINDTRDQADDQTSVTFTGEGEKIFTCKLEVFDEGGTVPVVCAHISGRIRCENAPTPTPEVTTITTMPTCLFSTGDVNQDGKVDLADVNVFVSTRMSGQSANENSQRTDLNCDGLTTQADWTILFQRLVGGP